MSGFYFQINEIRRSIYAPSSGPYGKPTHARGAHGVVNQGASNMWWLYDGKQIQQVGYRPGGSSKYSTYSVFYSEAFGFWILRGDASNPGEETWQPLCFDQDQYDRGSSYLCNVAQRRTVLYRRETAWMPMLLPDIYYANVQPTRNEAYGGLKGELAIFLALIAFSMRPELLPSSLPYMFQNGAWMTHTQPHGRQDERGVTVTIWTRPENKIEDLWNYEKRTKYFN